MEDDVLARPAVTQPGVDAEQVAGGTVRAAGQIAIHGHGVALRLGVGVEGQLLTGPFTAHRRIGAVHIAQVAITARGHVAIHAHQVGRCQRGIPFGLGITQRHLHAGRDGRGVAGAIHRFHRVAVVAGFQVAVDEALGLQQVGRDVHAVATDAVAGQTRATRIAGLAPGKLHGIVALGLGVHAPRHGRRLGVTRCFRLLLSAARGHVEDVTGELPATACAVAGRGVVQVPATTHLLVLVHARAAFARLVVGIEDDAFTQPARRAQRTVGGVLVARLAARGGRVAVHRHRVVLLAGVGQEGLALANPLATQGRVRAVAVAQAGTVIGRIAVDRHHVRIDRDLTGHVHAHHLRDGGRAGLVQDEHHVIAGGRVIHVGRQLGHQAVAFAAERQLDEALVHVERVRDRAGGHHRHATDGLGLGGFQHHAAAGLHHHRGLVQRGALGRRAVGVVQIGRVVDLGVEVALRTVGTATTGEQRAVRQQRGGGVVEAHALLRRAARPHTGLRVPEFQVVDGIARRGLVEVEVLGAPADGDRTIGQHGTVVPHAGVAHRAGIGHHGLVAADIDDGGTVAQRLGQQDAARLEHDGRTFPVGLVVQRAQVGTGAVAVQLHPVHLGLGEAEDVAVGGHPVARIVLAQVGGGDAGQQEVAAVIATDLGVVVAALAALHEDFAVGQRGGGGVPALALHLGSGLDGVAARTEDGRVVDGLVDAAAAGIAVDVATGDEHVARQRQHDLGRAEDVGLGGVGQREVGGVVTAQRRIPDVVVELGALLAPVGRAIGHHAAIGQHHGVDGDEGPLHLATPGTFGGSLGSHGQGLAGHDRVVHVGRFIGHREGADVLLGAEVDALVGHGRPGILGAVDLQRGMRLRGGQTAAGINRAAGRGGSPRIAAASAAGGQGQQRSHGSNGQRLAAQVVGHGNGREGADHDGFLWVEGAGKQPVSETRILGDGPDSRRAMLHTGPPSSDPDGCARTIVQVFLECLTESGFLYRSGPTDGRFVRRIRADD